MGSKSKSSSGGGGNRGKVLRQDYSSFKTPEATQAALNRQKKILDRNRTSTGAFANQADDLRKAGYTLNNTMDKVMSPTGGTIAGINKNNQLFSGSQNVSNILRNNLPRNPYEDRVANTDNVLNQIYGLDEMSKAGEEQINRAFDGGRGVKFANNPNPADPFIVTGSTPTFREMLGDVARGLIGGTAEQTIPNLSIANQPRNQEGILNAYKRIPTPINLLMKMFSGKEEEEPLNELQMQRQGYANDPYSVPTGPALPLDYLQGGFNRLQDLSPQDIIQENIPTLKESSQQEIINNMNFKDPISEDTSYVDKILRDLILSNSSRPTNAATGDISSIPFRPTLPATEGSYTYPQMFKGEEEPFRDANERIADTIGIPFDSRENQRNNIIEEYFEGMEEATPPTFDPNDPFANLASEYLPILTSFRNAGYNDSDIIDIFRKRNFLAFGGSVAPQSGPMSEGVGTLYRMK